MRTLYDLLLRDKHSAGKQLCHGDYREKPFEVDILERGEEISTGNNRTIPDGDYLITSGMSWAMSLAIAGIDVPDRAIFCERVAADSG